MACFSTGGGIGKMGRETIVCTLNADQRRQLDEAFAADAGLAAGLRPLLDGEFGVQARDLVLSNLARRLAAGDTVQAALLPALAEAMRVARGEGGGASGSPAQESDRAGKR
jgi:hypothetical protein